MKKILNSIRRNGPLLLIPFIPQVTIEEDGFVLNNKKILITDVVSVFYRNQYSQADTAHPLVGASMYEVATKSDLFFFYGEHPHLADFFDRHLEKESVFQNSYLGLVRRWKQQGTVYSPVSYRDTLSRIITEPISSRAVSKKWLFVALGVFLLCLLAIPIGVILVLTIWG
mgnify:FL=1